MQSITGNANMDIAKMLAELRDGFIADLPSRLEEVEDLILGLKNTAAFSDDYQSLYRHVHSIKGSAGTHGLHIVSTVCHAFEDLIIEVEGDQALLTDKHISKWLKYIDLLRTTLHVIDESNEDFTEIESELASLAGKGTEYEFRGLMVMSSELHRKLCLCAFENQPVKFSYATSGYEALGLLLKEPYDLLVTNMEVSDLQGMSVISALRLTNNRNSRIPTMLLTSAEVEQYHKDIDPDYVIKKDSALMDQLNVAASEIVKQLKQSHVDD